jgi:dTDP-6-deoxy-L-talose 4-dehydrogenase (NAD+)
MDLRNKKILVTGANGYIGRNLLEFLSYCKLNVTAVGRKFDNLLPHIKYIEEDIFNIENPFIFFDKPDVCIHLAWKNGFIHNSLNHIDELPLHYKFLKNLLDNNISKVNVIGTMHEIGYHNGVVNNYTISNPTTLYGIAKDTLRRLVFSINKSNVNWLRLFYVYGNDSSNPSVFGKLLAAVKEGKPTFPINSGKNKYDFLSIDELVKQITIASLQLEIPGIINCCSGKAIPLDVMLNEYIKINKLIIKLSYNQFPDRLTESKFIYGDDNLIRHIMKKYSS